MEQIENLPLYKVANVFLHLFANIIKAFGGRRILFPVLLQTFEWLLELCLITLGTVTLFGAVTTGLGFS